MQSNIIIFILWLTLLSQLVKLKFILISIDEIPCLLAELKKWTCVIPFLEGFNARYTHMKGVLVEDMTFLGCSLFYLRKGLQAYSTLKI